MGEQRLIAAQQYDLSMAVLTVLLNNESACFVGTKFNKSHASIVVLEEYGFRIVQTSTPKG